MLVAAGITAVAVAGCGGDDDKTDQADFVKQANAVCKVHRDRTSAASAQLLAGGKLPTPQQFGRLAMGTIIPQYAAQVRELEALKAPEDQDAAYRAWLSDSKALLGKLGTNPALIQNPQTFADVNRQARALGLSRSCDAGPT